MKKIFLIISMLTIVILIPDKVNAAVDGYGTTSEEWSTVGAYCEYSITYNKVNTVFYFVPYLEDYTGLYQTLSIVYVKGNKVFPAWGSNLGMFNDKPYTDFKNSKILKCPKICYGDDGNQFGIDLADHTNNCKNGNWTGSVTGTSKTKKVGSYSDSEHEKPTENFLGGENVEVSCNGIFTPQAVELVREIMGYFQILGPSVLILLTAVDFGKAVMGQDDKDLSKSSGKILKRVVAMIALFLVPTFVRVLLGIDGIKNSLTLSNDPLCLSASGANENGK